MSEIPPSIELGFAAELESLSADSESINPICEADDAMQIETVPMSASSGDGFNGREIRSDLHEKMKARLSQKALPPVEDKVEEDCEASRPAPQAEDKFIYMIGTQVAILQKIEKVLEDHSSATDLIADARLTFERKNTVNKSMFDALYTELKSYKDAFILESILRPVIHDLVILYDDASDIHRHLSSMLLAIPIPEGVDSVMTTIRNNVLRLEHHVHFLVEVLERLNVVQMPASVGKLDKMLQKAVAVENTAIAEEDQAIVRTVKLGFMWKERIFRPEEVVIRKFIPAQQLLKEFNPSAQEAPTAS